MAHYGRSLGAALERRSAATVFMRLLRLVAEEVHIRFRTLCLYLAFEVSVGVGNCDFLTLELDDDLTIHDVHYLVVPLGDFGKGAALSKADSRLWRSDGDFRDADGLDVIEVV